jgi:hypothetical protein
LVLRDEGRFVGPVLRLCKLLQEFRETLGNRIGDFQLGAQLSSDRRLDVPDYDLFFARMKTTVPLHGTFSAPALPIFRLKAPNQRRLTLDPPKSELGALLLVLLGGQRNVLCSVPDNLDLLARRETGENAPTIKHLVNGIASPAAKWPANK